jgi:membrane protease YdiL (CAAX protease family)
VVGESFDQTQDLGLESISGWLLPLTFIALVIVPPIVEEVLFRGFLYGRLNYHRYSMLVSALVTSVAFALVHGQLNVGVDTFVLSMVMIYMLEKRQSLWVTITMHAIKNTVAFLALFVFKIV